MASATPGGAPGYDYDKEFGNNITHSRAQTSQRLRGYTARSPEVKGRTLSARFGQCSGVPAVRRVFLRSLVRMADAPWPERGKSGSNRLAASGFSSADLLSSARTRVVQMPHARIADVADLTSLLSLFEASDVSRYAEPKERAEQIWAETLARDGLAVFVSDADARVVATCMLITVPNLLRGGRQHGIIENVVTHPDYQGRGHGRSVIGAALDEAWRRDCHHVLLQSGRADPRVHRFYESCGFKPGLRTSYAALRPASTN